MKLFAKLLREPLWLCRLATSDLPGLKRAGGPAGHGAAAAWQRGRAAAAAWVTSEAADPPRAPAASTAGLVQEMAEAVWTFVIRRCC